MFTVAVSVGSSDEITVINADKLSKYKRFSRSMGVTINTVIEGVYGCFDKMTVLTCFVAGGVIQSGNSQSEF